MSLYRVTPQKTSKLPSGIGFIIGNEAAERFSFYGMRSVLLAYMTIYLVQPNGESAIFKEKEAEAWVHLFVGSAYFFPLIGGILADAFWGKYRTILSLSLFYCLGHGCLAMMGILGDTRTLLFAGLVLIAVGAGGIKPCVSAHVGDQFNIRNNHLLTQVFGWFYFSINIGAFLSGLLTPFLLEATREAGSLGERIYPIVEPWVGEKLVNEPIFGPHYAFGLPGILMAIATFIFWLGRKQFAHIPPRGKIYFKETFSGENLRAILRLCSIFAFVVIFWALFDQIGTLWQIQARSLDRVLPDWIPLIGGSEMLAAQVSAIWNPLFILLLIPVFSYIIYPFFSQFFEVTPLRKIGFGLWVMGFAFTLVALLQERIDLGESPNMGWQILACLLLTGSEVLVSITCLEFAYTQAPKEMKSFVMAIFLLTVSLGNYFTSAVKFFIINEDGSSKLPGSSEFWFWTVLVFIAALIFIRVSKNYVVKEYLQET
ncbi:POT-type proton-dependent oligopeptide transporter [Candidatus Seribacter sulfatis]|uniref:POT-type proton-dependent oligopeptide transporter n=1 Tax=Candidatus Seribacter sulfatis TaxID=3381756 RepID=UPI00389B1A5B